MRQLSEFCDYGETLDQMLRDRLVCGVLDGKIQRRLLAEPDLTLATALCLSQSMVTAKKDTQLLKRGRKGQEPHSSLL